MRSGQWMLLRFYFFNIHFWPRVCFYRSNNHSKTTGKCQLKVFHLNFSFKSRECLANPDKVDKSNSTSWLYRKTYSNQSGCCRFISPCFLILPLSCSIFSFPVSLSPFPSSSTKTVQLIQPAICLQSSLITHLTGFTYYWLANKGESKERER